MLRAVLLDAVRCFPFESFSSYNSRNNRLSTLIWYGNFRIFLEILNDNPFFHFSYNVLPSEVKETPSIAMQPPSIKTDLKISIKHTGPQIPILFHHVFCEYCKANTLPKLLNKYKDDLPEPANFVNLIANWDV